MKLPAQLLTILFVVAALGLTVWLGRYHGAIPVGSSTGKVKNVEVAEFPIQEQGPYGKAVIGETTHDFGASVLGAKGSHVFVIKNEGEGPLRVKTGKTSCSQCTVGRVSREDDIPPGESVDVEIKWEIKAPNDRFRQWAEVFTTDPDLKRIELVIEGLVDQTLRLAPEGVWLVGDLSPTEPTVVRGLLYSRLVDTIVLDKFECSNPSVSVTWEPVSLDLEEVKEKKAKAALSITATVAAGALLGPFRETVKLISADQGQTPVEFQLFGQRSGPIEFKGRGWNPENNAVVLGEFPAEKGARVKLNLYVRNLDGELEVQVIEQKHNSAKIQIPPTGRVLGKSKMYEVEIEVPPGPPVMRRGPDAEKIRLKLNHPDASEFVFYISYHAL
ncbi:MAG: DUF1573 domain-containing protein [Planctomycetota bacterium]